jgi:hypothetical protein
MKYRHFVSAIQGNATGLDGYRRSNIGLAAGRQLGHKASLGVRINYHQLKITGYGQIIRLTADAGFVLHLSDKLDFAVQLINPASADLNNALYLPAIYSAGLGYEQSDQFYISFEFRKEQAGQMNGLVTLQYKLPSSLFIRIAVQTREPSFVFGAGFTRSRLRVDVYSSYHLRLGMGSGIRLFWLWKDGDTAR